MAYKARILPSAQDELEEIAAYLAGFGPQTLANFLNEFEKQIALLETGMVDYVACTHPRLARLGYHRALVNNYLFLYYFEKDEVVVAHIFHQRQDYARLV